MMFSHCIPYWNKHIVEYTAAKSFFIQLAAMMFHKYNKSQVASERGQSVILSYTVRICTQGDISKLSVLLYGVTVLYSV